MNIAEGMMTDAYQNKLDTALLITAAQGLYAANQVENALPGQKNRRALSPERTLVCFAFALVDASLTIGRLRMALPELAAVKIKTNSAGVTNYRPNS